MAAAMARGHSYYAPIPLRQTCTICRSATGSAWRKAWGCDVPTATPQMWLPCVRCDGANPACTLCGGGGYEPVHRCPWTHGLDESAELLWWHSLFPGALPESGAVGEQGAKYVDAMRVIARAGRKLDSVAAQLQQKPPKG